MSNEPIDSNIVYSKIERLPWKDILGKTLSKKIYEYLNEGNNKEEIQNKIFNNNKLKQYIINNYNDQDKIYHNINISISARIAEFNSQRGMQHETNATIATNETNIENNNVIETPMKHETNATSETNATNNVADVADVSNVSCCMGSNATTTYPINEMKSYFFTLDNEKKIASSLLNGPKTYKEIEEDTKLKNDTIRLWVHRNKDKTVLIEKKENKLHLTERGKVVLEHDYEEHLEKNNASTNEEISENTDYQNRISMFLTENYYDHLLVKKVVFIDYAVLIKYDPGIGELLLTDAPRFFKCLYTTLETDFNKKGTKVKFFNLYGAKRCINNLKDTKNINSFVEITGDISTRSKQLIIVKEATFECPSCLNKITIPQFENQKITEPNRCTCGRKGLFAHMQDYDVTETVQKIKLKESVSDINTNRSPEEIYLEMKNELLQPKFREITEPGKKIKVNGVVKTRYKQLPQSNAKATQKEWYIDVEYIEPLEEDYSDLEITDEEIEKFKQEKDMINNAKKAFSEIYGHDELKEALLLQQVDGNRVIDSEGRKKYRGEIHIMCISDPSMGKSDLLQILRNITPKYRKVVGSGVSGAGLTSSVHKDEFIGEWVLVDGKIVSANNGLLAIDEGDKINPDDIKKLHEALENGSISIDKAGIKAELPAKTSVFLVGNPKHGRFSKYDDFYRQIPFESTFRTRFDLTFMMVDLATEKDQNIIDKIINREKSSEKIDMEYIRKYIAYAKQIRPSLQSSAQKVVRDYYLQLRNKSKDRLLITTRQAEGLIRLSAAYAKWRLSDKIEAQDAEKAVSLYSHCIKSMLDEQGKLDIDTLEVGRSSATRKKHRSILEKLPATYEEVLQDEGVTDEDIGYLLKMGEMIENPKGTLRRLE